MKPTKEQTTAIRNVLGQLAEYNGEEIVAHEHPLHHAVAALEKFCIRLKRSCLQPYVLYRPAKMQWFLLIWASRPAMPTALSLEDYHSRRADRSDANPEVALAWTVELAATLSGWLEYFPQNKCDVPGFGIER